MPDQTPLEEWRIREIARESAKEAVKDFCERMGIEDVNKTRRNLDYLSLQVQAAEGRRSEGRKTIFTILGSLGLAAISYLAAKFSFQGHLP